MDASGIDIMVNLSGGSLDRSTGDAVRLARALPGRIYNFYTPRWSDLTEPGWADREAYHLEIAVTELGFKGLKISKALGLYIRDEASALIPVDDPRLDPLWERAGQLGIPVSIHTSDPKAFWEPSTPDNERYEELSHHPSWSFYGEPVPSRGELLAERDRLVERHPATTFVCVHFGNNPEDLAYVDRLLTQYDNVHVDLAARVPEIGRHPADAVHAFFVKHQDRILFATDIGIGKRSIMLGSTGKEQPTEADAARFYATHWRFLETRDTRFAHPTPVQGKWTIDGIGLPKSVLRKIYRDNALKLLRL